MNRWNSEKAGSALSGLRGLCIEARGLITPSLRVRVWPVLLGVIPSDDKPPHPSDIALNHANQHQVNPRLPFR